jgi:hypothetical protein
MILMVGTAGELREMLHGWEVPGVALSEVEGFPGTRAPGAPLMFSSQLLTVARTLGLTDERSCPSIERCWEFVPASKDSHVLINDIVL